MTAAHYIGIFSALGSAAAWAIGSVLYQKIGKSISALNLNLVKNIMSLALLALVLLFTGFSRLPAAAFILLGLSGLLGIALGDTLFFAALQGLGAHPLVVLSLSGKILTIFFAVTLLGEKLSIQSWAGVILVILGITAVFGFKKSVRKKTKLKDIGYGLLSVLATSLAVIMIKAVLNHNQISALQVTFIRIFWSVLGLAFWSLLAGDFTRSLRPFKDTKLLRRIFLAVCIGTFGGFWLFHVSLKSIDVAVANTLNSTVPLFTLPLSVIFLKEKLSAAKLLGTFVSLAGIVLISFG